MAAGHMEVAEKLPGGSDSILQSKDVLEKMPRKELQALAKERGITANSKSAVIIEKILMEQHFSEKLSEEELRGIADSKVHLSSQRTFERKFEELQLEHARVMASMAEALAKYEGMPGYSVFTNETVVQRYEEAEKHMTSTIHQMFEKAVNRLSQAPPVPSIKRKARKKKAKMAPPEPPKV